MRGNIAHVEPVTHHDTRIRAKFPCNLSGADIKRMNRACSGLQEAIGKASGRGAEVGAKTTCHRNLKSVECCPKLHARSAYERQPANDSDHASGSDQVTRFFHFLLIDQHLSGENYRLRFLATFRASTFDKKVVNSPLRHDWEKSGTSLIFTRCD
jgi:hypothetical protein